MTPEPFDNPTPTREIRPSDLGAGEIVVDDVMRWESRTVGSGVERRTAVLASRVPVYLRVRLNAEGDVLATRAATSPIHDDWYEEFANDARGV